jgi:hypothetical protein
MYKYSGKFRLQISGPQGEGEEQHGVRDLPDPHDLQVLAGEDRPQRDEDTRLFTSFRRRAQLYPCDYILLRCRKLL